MRQSRITKHCQQYGVSFDGAFALAMYNRLGRDEQKEIDNLCDKLIDGLRKRHRGKTKPQFGKICALELLMKIGAMTAEGK